ncbi:MAG TPA: VOC family protein [Candidatus Cybelea sp.]|nr:VOC family protein [Candidatus Cybelea sp.]
MITPFLWFDDRAEEAANFYVSVFKNSKIDKMTYYGDAGPGEKGRVMTVEFTLEGQEFMALNGGPTEGPVPSGPVPGAIALFVDCATQADVDNLWDKLSDGGQKMQCGWVKDRFNVVWNVVPAGLGDVLRGEDPEGSERAFKAMLRMEKLDIDELRRAYEGVAR